MEKNVQCGGFQARNAFLDTYLTFLKQKSPYSNFFRVIQSGEGLYRIPSLSKNQPSTARCWRTCTSLLWQPDLLLFFVTDQMCDVAGTVWTPGGLVGRWDSRSVSWSALSPAGHPLAHVHPHPHRAAATTRGG